MGTGSSQAQQVNTRAEPHRLQCMEVWSGNQAVDNALSVPGVDLWVHCRPHLGHQAGGDIHYVSMCGSGRISRFVIADVAGHGQGVSELAATLRRLMRRNINRVNQARFARALSDEFLRLSTGGCFATAVLATYFAPDDHLLVVNAGHPAPLWYRAASGAWTGLEPEVPERAERARNLPLGVVRGTKFRQFGVRLERGDLVLMYTDSLIEALSPQGTQLGREGLCRLLADLDPSHPDLLPGLLLEAVAGWRGRTEADDDSTILLLHHNAANPSWPGMASVVRSLGKLVGLVDY